MSLKSLFSAKDMTIGSPWKRIMEFSVPMILGNIAQQLYNTADSVIVGHYVGDNALAAVGSASPILMLLLALFVGWYLNKELVRKEITNDGQVSQRIYPVLMFLLRWVAPIAILTMFVKGLIEMFAK